ncbi:hypothetical protein F7C95_09640 [Opitutia bacterium ISCC 51]|nr:hypothetical protein F7C95_09640 [Opitutae bacterium ISCC 51]QXD30178.1 hypothetical protein GA003_09585 [Opitutae bacterium ISCC 52]
MATTPPLLSDADREQALWTIAEYVRPDTSIMPRLAGYALSQRSSDTTQHYNWNASIEKEAEKLGLSALAERWIDQADLPEQP